MFKGFGTLLLKELKELIRDPKILLGFLIVPLIMFPVLGYVLNLSMQTAQESALKATLLVLNHDSGENSTEFMSFLNSTIRVYTVDVPTAQDAVPLLSGYNATGLVEIPSDFSQNVSARRPVDVKFFTVFSGSGLYEQVGSSIVTLW